MAIDNDLQQYGEELMRHKEGAMWRDVNGAPGTGAHYWVAHVDGLDICGKGVHLFVDEKRGTSAFLAFAPKDNPRIAIISYIKGSLNAGNETFSRNRSI